LGTSKLKGLINIANKPVYIELSAHYAILE